MTSTNSDLPEGKDVLETSAPAGTAIPQIEAHSATTPDEPAFGWSAYAERVNGRFAMIGFIAVLIIEALSNEAFLNWAGLMQ